MIAGVSIVICCYNSAGRLRPTLAHVCAQLVSPGIPWEVILVDNASTDATQETARALWPPDAPAPLRIVREEQPGLSHARRRGLQEAQYEYVSFIDDDNWVTEYWVQTVFTIMSNQLNVGACGGRSYPTFEKKPPAGFDQFYLNMAIGEQWTTEGDITETRGWLWGAGLIIRRAAWEQIVKLNWSSMMIGRKGKTLSSGEDTEICYWLRLLGWRIYYSPKLSMKHYIPAFRMQKSYIYRLFNSGGYTILVNKAYKRMLSGNYTQVKQSILRLWLVDLRSTFLTLIKSLFNKKSVKSIYNQTFINMEVSMTTLYYLLRLGPWGYQNIYNTINKYCEQSSSIRH